MQRRSLILQHLNEDADVSVFFFWFTNPETSIITVDLFYFFTFIDVKSNKTKNLVSFSNLLSYVEFIYTSCWEFEYTLFSLNKPGLLKKINISFKCDMP